jgi:hypothetical protein
METTHGKTHSENGEGSVGGLESHPPTQTTFQLFFFLTVPRVFLGAKGGQKKLIWTTSGGAGWGGSRGVQRPESFVWRIEKFL